MKKGFWLLSFLVLFSVILGSAGAVNPQEALALTYSSPQPSANYYTWSDWLASYAARTRVLLPASTASTVAPTSNPTYSPGQNTSNNSSLQARASDENWMLTQINRERTMRGIAPLTLDPTLVELSRKKSQDIVINDYFAHESPTYGNPSKMVKDAGVKYWLCGENLARAATVAAAHQLLMDSSVHRSNILNRNYTHVGVGIMPQKSGNGIVVTQLFIAK